MAKSIREKKIEQGRDFFEGRLSESDYHRNIDALESRENERRSSQKIEVKIPDINLNYGGGGKQKRNFFKEGLQESLGKWKATQRLHRNPIGATLFLLFLYAFFSLGPIRIFPALSLIYYFWGGTLLFAIFTGNFSWIFIWLAVFILFNFALVANLFSIGDFYSQDFQEKFNFRSIHPIQWAKSKIYSSYGPWKDPKKVEEVETKGITFNYFRPDDRYFMAGEPVSLTAEVTVDGVSDEYGQYQSFPLQFSCYEQHPDYSIGNIGNVYVDYSETSLTEAITVPAQEKTTYAVLCRFDKGLSLITSLRTSRINSEISSAIGLPELSQKNISDFTDNRTLKTIVLEAKAKFSQTGSLKLYTVLDEQKPPQLNDAVADPDVEKDGKVRSHCISGCGGPYLLSLSTSPQPFTERQQPRLSLELYRYLALGDIAHIDSLSLALPEGVTLVHTPTTPCDFLGISARQEKLDKLNTNLDALTKLRRKGEDAIDPSLKLQCFFKVEHPPERPTAKILQARAVYDVLLQKRALVEIVGNTEISPST